MFFGIYTKIYKQLSAKNCQENRERLQKKLVKRYQNLFKEEIEEKQQYGQESYKNISGDGKNKLFEYRKKIIKWEKNALL